MLAEKIAKASSTSKATVSFLMVAIVMLVAYNWLVRPQTTYLQAARRYETVMSSADEKSSLIQKKIRGMQNNIGKISGQTELLRKYFFSARQAKEFFFDLETAATGSRCVIESLNFLPARTPAVGKDGKESSKLATQSLDITLTGKYESIMKFMKELAAYPQTVDVSSVDITSAGEKGLLCRMIVTIYLLDDKESGNYEN